jgi:hypothetical protein
MDAGKLWAAWTALALGSKMTECFSLLRPSSSGHSTPRDILNAAFHGL